MAPFWWLLGLMFIAVVVGILYGWLQLAYYSMTGSWL